MNRSVNEDAQMTHSRRDPSGARPSESYEQVVQRWRGLRELLIRQLEMFETGGLTLHSNDEDVSSSAIVDLKRSILEFDVLISGDSGSANGG
jgi:hypothetical protein